MMLDMSDGLRTAQTGRDARGRFTRGNPGGPGRPPAASAHEHRRALLAAVTPEDIAAVIRRVLSACVADGDMVACRLLLDRVLGRVVDSEVLERIETLELASDGDSDNGGERL